MNKVYGDAGHGGSDPGAVANGLKEKDLAIKVIKYMCAYLKKNYVVEVYQDITDDSTTTISRRANTWGADLFVSVHFNAGRGDGYEALVYGKDTLKLGQTFEKRVKAIGQNSRGIKYRPDLNVLKSTKMKAILNECAFIDNKNDIKDWNENAELKKMGEALAKAAADWLDLKKKTTTKAASSTAAKAPASKSYQVKVTSPALNMRKGPGASYDVVSIIRDKGIYTIIEEKNGFGKLKSGTGWISLKYTEKM